MVVVLGLATAAAWAVANLFTQQLSRQRLDPRAVMAWVLVISASCLVPVALLLHGTEGPWTPRALIAPALAGLFANLGFLCLLRALRTGNLSVVAPIIAVEGGIAALMAIVLGERPTPLQLGLLGVAVVGAVLVGVEPGRRTAAGAGWAAVAAVAYAGALVALGSAEQPPITGVAVARVASVLLIIPFLLVAAQRLPPRPSRRPLLGCGLLDAAGFAAFGLAAAIGPLSIASVTATQWGTAAAVIGIVFLRERLRPTQYAGIAVTLVAVTGLGLLG
jgi:drug/metabolite transporter (DMT)-like permease